MSLSLGYAVFLLSLWRPNCWTHVGFANSGGLVFVDESAEKFAAV